MVRRAMALVILLAVTGGVVSVVKAVFGDDDSGALAGPSSSPTDATTGDATGAGSGDEPTGQSGAADSAADTVAPTAAPTTPPDAGKTPTKDDPARLLIVGDSDAGTFGPYLKRLMNQTGVVDTTLDYKVSSGLARPDFFDWPAHLVEELPKANPDIVVVTFGGNDGQNITDHSRQLVARSSDQEKWRAEYGKRAGEVMDLLAADGRTLIWVGIPNGPTSTFTERVRMQDEVVKAEAAKRPEVVFIDTWNRFVGIDGGWAEYVIDPRDGEGKDVRAKDGFHLNETGAEILALDIARAINKDLRARGAKI